MRAAPGARPAIQPLSVEKAAFYMHPERMEIYHYLYPARSYKKHAAPLLWTITGLLLVGIVAGPSSATDLRTTILNGDEACIKYDSNALSFEQTCDVVWSDRGYGSDHHILLESSETFHGNDHIIDLGGITSFEGLFEVSDSVTTFGNAPKILSVHIRDGVVAPAAGFLLRQKQKFFYVHGCSSSGEIGGGEWSGGLSGFRSGSNGGHVMIENSYTSGDMTVISSGGIMGSDAGYNGGKAIILRCYSLGQIGNSGGARAGGGITGWGPGRKGFANVTQCYSLGDIVGRESGGILGADSGREGGSVYVTECFSSGDIIGEGAGGISGDEMGQNNGFVQIKDSYTTGTIKQDNTKTGGICGILTAELGGTVVIENVYMLSKPPSRTFMIGEADPEANCFGDVFLECHCKQQSISNH